MELQSGLNEMQERRRHGDHENREGEAGRRIECGWGVETGCSNL